MTARKCWNSQSLSLKQSFPAQLSSPLYFHYLTTGKWYYQRRLNLHSIPVKSTTILRPPSSKTPDDDWRSDYNLPSQKKKRGDWFGKHNKQAKEKSDQAGLNRRPLNLQSNALPLSYSRSCFLLPLSLLLFPVPPSTFRMEHKNVRWAAISQTVLIVKSSSILLLYKQIYLKGMILLQCLL